MHELLISSQEYEKALMRRRLVEKAGASLSLFSGKPMQDWRSTDVSEPVIAGCDDYYAPMKGSMVVNIVSFEFGYMMMEVALKVDSLVTPLDKAMVPAEYTTLEKGEMSLNALMFHALRWDEFCPLFYHTGGPGSITVYTNALLRLVERELWPQWWKRSKTDPPPPPLEDFIRLTWAYQAPVRQCHASRQI